MAPQHATATTDEDRPLLPVLIPGLDGGFRLAPGPEGAPHDLAPDLVPAASLSAVVASDHPDQRLQLYQFIATYRATRGAKCYLRFKSFPAVVEQFEFSRRTPTVGGRVLLSGASALRMRTRTIKRIADRKVTEPAHEAWLLAGKARKKSVPVLSPARWEAAKDLPFLVEARNFFNFYHFTTETLIYLQMYRDYGLRGPILLLSGSNRPLKPFIRRLVEDFYPELADRVEYETRRTQFDRAILPFNTNHLYHLSTPAMMPDVEPQVGLGSPDQPGHLREPTLANYKTLYNNSLDEYVVRHREAALTLAATRSTATRFYVGRKPGASKDRGLAGEAELVAMLSRHGFETVYFEDLSPREQAGIANRAEVLVSAHGAGFANMLYARPGSHFIELSHLQTARHRLGDFNMHAAASGAHHLHFFVDHDYDGDDDAVPDIDRDGHTGVAMSPASIDRLEGLVAIVTDVPAYQQFFSRLADLVRRGEGAAAVALAREHPLYLRGCARTCAAAAQGAEIAGDTAQAIALLRDAVALAPFRADFHRRLIALCEAAGDGAGAGAARALHEQFGRYRWMRWHRAVSGATILQARD